MLTLRATTTLDEPSERVTVSDDGAIGIWSSRGHTQGGQRSVARRRFIVTDCISRLTVLIDGLEETYGGEGREKSRPDQPQRKLD